MRAPWLLLMVVACTAPHRSHRLEDAWTEAGGEPNLRALTFNTWSIPHRDDHVALRDRTVRAVAQIPADIIALQELWRADDARAYARALRRVGLVHVRYLASERPLFRGSSGLLLASRFPFADERFRAFLAGSTPFWPWPPDWYATKGMLDVHLETPGGRVRVINTHLHAAYGRGGHAGIRLGQALELVDAVRRGDRGAPTLVLGDLNAYPDELPYRALLGLTRLRPVARSFVDGILTMDGRHERLVPREAELALTDTVALPGRRSPMSDHAGIRAGFSFSNLDAGLPATERPGVASRTGEGNENLRNELLEALRATGSRAERHRFWGRAASIGCAALVLLLLLRRRRILPTLLVTLAGAWAAYHGWLLGPIEAEVTRGGTAIVLEDAAVVPNDAP